MAVLSHCSSIATDVPHIFGGFKDFSFVIEDSLPLTLRHFFSLCGHKVQQLPTQISTLSSQSKISPHCDENPDYKGGKASPVTPKKAPSRKSGRGSSSSSSSCSSASQLDVGTSLTDATLVAIAAKAAKALRSQVHKDPEKLKEENDIIFGTCTAEASPFDRFHDMSKRRRLMKVMVRILFTDTADWNKPFAAHLSGATIELRKTLYLAPFAATSIKVFSTKNWSSSTWTRTLLVTSPFLLSRLSATARALSATLTSLAFRMLQKLPGSQ